MTASARIWRSHDRAIQQHPDPAGDNELNAVSGGHQKFHYDEMNGHTYAIGHINGRTVAVRID